MEPREGAALVFALLGVAMIAFPRAFRAVKEGEEKVLSGLKPVPGHPMRSLVVYRLLGIIPIGIAVFLLRGGP